MANLAQVIAGQSDNVFGDDGGAHQLATVTGDVSKGFVATLTAPVDTDHRADGRRCARWRWPGRSGREPAERGAPVRRPGWRCTEWRSERLEHDGLTARRWGLVLL